MKAKEFEKKLEKAKKNLDKLLDSNLSLSDGLKFYKDGISELELATKMLQEAKLEFEELKKGD